MRPGPTDEEFTGGQLRSGEVPIIEAPDGVGFLLRVTDVERQPFRSMGFVSIIIVSVLFALGLPLVLL